MGSNCGLAVQSVTERQLAARHIQQMGNPEMATELTLLAWTVALTILQLLVAIVGATTQFSPPALAGNREPPLEAKGWVGRAQRAHRNMLESLVPFAALVLIVNAAAVSNEATVLGAKLFLYGRIAYALIYLAGIPWVRTVAWTVSLFGMLMILWQVI
jgi:uncharacterized MAPEG superfamily protein